ncbi:MAG: GMC family oxidoreductase [Rhodobacteraceae bacterium]|nr:GMC family oxidoreductase [Paracoccaceae bacterium]
MRVAVIGSGLAGLAATQALVRAGLKPVVIDSGERLPAERAAAVARMRGCAPTEWDPRDRALVSLNPSVSASGIPSKLAFGSDYFFRQADPVLPFRGSGAVFPTSAAGGVSVAWGATVLAPPRPEIVDWPIDVQAFEAAARRVRGWLPLAADMADGLSPKFPTFGPTQDLPPMSPSVEAVAAALSEKARGRGVAFGRARLALLRKVCRECGFCLHGCPYGAIYSAEDAFDEFYRAGKAEKCHGIGVEDLSEEGEGVRIKGRSLEDRSPREFVFDRVFLAAGALNSTHILMRSLPDAPPEVRLRTSQKFVLPLLLWRATRDSGMSRPTLAELFIEYESRAAGGRWVHCQVSGPNDMLAQRLGADRGGARGMIGRAVLARAVVLWASLHSDRSGGLTARLERAADGRSTMVLTEERNPLTAATLRGVSAEIRGHLRGAGLILPVGGEVARIGSGNHIGSSFPMMRVPHGLVSSDPLGRPGRFRRVHVVDSSILPDIPATTIAFASMTLADHVVTAALEAIG